MKEQEMNNDATQKDLADGGACDVETAGETTAAACISGPTDERPVGADTMIKVADAPDHLGSSDA
jgi:hypothetical protein